MSDLIKLGALWIKKDKRGRSYLTGRFSASTRLMIFKNEYKTADNQPDYEMYLAAIEPVEGVQQPRQTTDDFLDEGVSPARSTPPRRETSPSDDDIGEDTPDTRRPQTARTNAPTSAQPPRSTARTAQNGSAPATTARPTRNAPSPPNDSDDDLDDPFEN